MFKVITLISTASATFCSYPQYSIPGTFNNVSAECQTDLLCPIKVPEPECDDIYGVFEGDQCAVFCENAAGRLDSYQPEFWECVGDETWQLVGDPVECEPYDGFDMGISGASFLASTMSLLYLSFTMV